MILTFNKQVRKLLVVIAIPLVSAFAQGAEADDMTRELGRFVKAYRVAESGEISLKISIQIAANQGQANKQFVECISSKLTPATYEEAALDVARQQFNNLENLKAINAFFESAAGRKVMDQAMLWHSSNFKRLLDGLEPLPPQPASYTQKEWGEIKTWEKTPAYVDLQHFVDDGMRNIHSNDSVKKRLAALKAQCAAPVAG
jgi:hypothetical protein